MPLLQQEEADAISTTLQRVTLNQLRIPETEIAAWFVNLSDGPQFWLGSPPQQGMQPLYFEPVREGQEPVAWRAGSHITQDRYMYRSDLDWKPLYPARSAIACLVQS